MNKWKTKFRELIIFVLGIIFATCSIVLAETCQTTLSSNNVTYDNTTVQAETNELITQAGNIDSRLSSIESRFINGSTADFDAGLVHVTQKTASDNAGYSIKKNSTNELGALYYQASGEQLILRSDNPSGAWGQGTLNLVGNPVKINGNTVSPTIKYKTVTLSNITFPANGYYSIGSSKPSGMNNFLFCVVWTYGTTSTVIADFDVNAQGNYLRGTPNTKVDRIDLRYFYTD